MAVGGELPSRRRGRRGYDSPQVRHRARSRLHARRCSKKTRGDREDSRDRWPSRSQGRLAPGPQTHQPASRRRANPHQYPPALVRARVEAAGRRWRSPFPGLVVREFVETTCAVVAPAAPSSTSSQDITTCPSDHDRPTHLSPPRTRRGWGAASDHGRRRDRRGCAQAREVARAPAEEQQARLRRDGDAHLVVDPLAVAANEVLLRDEHLHELLQLAPDVEGQAVEARHAPAKDRPPGGREGRPP